MLLDFKVMTEEHENIILNKELSSNFKCYNINHEEDEIETLFDKEEYDFFVSFYDEEIVGFLEIFFEKDIMEVGFAVLKDKLDEGFGTDFVSQAVEFLVDHYIYDGEVIRTIISADDQKELEILERVGFVECDISKEWIELEIGL